MSKNNSLIYNIMVQKYKRKKCETCIDGAVGVWNRGPAVPELVKVTLGLCVISVLRGRVNPSCRQNAT